MRERNESGKSVRVYCQRAGIREKTYYYWQRKLRETACEELSNRTKKEVVSSETFLAPNGWVVCKTEESRDQGKPLIVEINGFRVQVERDTAPDHLANVCRALKSIC
jgi:transposase-like protein